MPIKLLMTGSQPPLRAFLITCDERVNLFIGPNASGKSTILRELKRFYSKDRNWVLHFERVEELLEEVERCFNIQNRVNALELERESRTLSDEMTELLAENLDLMDQLRGIATRLANLFFSRSRDPVHLHRHIYCSNHDDWNHKFVVAEDTSESRATSWDTSPLMYIPATRINVTEDGRIDKNADGEEYSIEGLLGTTSGNFYGQDVALAIDWLRKNLIGNRHQQNQFRSALELGYSCTRSICAEVIHDDAPHTYIEIKEDEYHGVPWVDPAERVVHYSMGVGTNDNITGEPLYAGVLSSGTQGTLLWIYALALKMAHCYDWQEGWEKKPAILLIDEIENHLHPTWQRRVIPALLEHFPGLQIFATTHSPFVVAGLKAGQVHLLQRDGNGIVTSTTNTEDIVGWTADEILRTMMGVEDPTDAETAAAARKLRQLRNEGPRSDPKSEEQRQEEMQQLRRRVDRDLLAGGPWKKQRELFEEQFADVLKKYQQSQDLNQENR